MKKIRRWTVLVLAAALLLVLMCGAQALQAVETTDSRGKLTGITWQDDDGNPAAGPEGYAEVRYTYDYTDGPKTTEMYFDAAGNPYRMPGGYYGRAVTLAYNGDVGQVEYLDEKGALTMTAGGYSRIIYTYRSFGAESKSAFLGTKRGEGGIVPSLGYAQIETEHTGKVVTGRFFRDTRGKAVDSVFGYSSMIRKQNRSRTLITQTYYVHADGKPATGPDGWFKCVVDQDANGRIAEIKYLDEDSNLTDAGGFAREAYTYDQDGDPIITRYNAAGIRIPFGGDAVSVLRVMKGEQIISETYLNETGGPTALPDGYATAEYNYDDAGRLTATQYRSANGEKTICAKGYSAVRQTWDAEGKLVSRIYLDANGSNVNSTDGFCEEQYLYDTTGLLRGIRQYRADGTQVD